MRRILAVLTLLLTGALVGSGAWMLLHPSVTPFLIPGATNIQVVSIGVWEWQITYDTSGPPYAWSYALMHALTERQWHDRTRWHADVSPMFDQVNPLRLEWDDAGVLWDEVMLTPDHRYPQRATITLRRHLRIPWQQNWSPAAYQGAAVIAGRKVDTTLPRR